MSLCDSCFAPGACCRGFALGVSVSSAINSRDMDVATAALARIKEGGAPPDAIPLPFVPTAWSDLDGGHWKWACTKVSEEGRCTIYETRPQLCRLFEAGSDALCVHHRGAESDERSVL